MARSKSHRRRGGYLPLWMALTLAVIVVIGLVIWTIQAMSPATSDGRQTIVFWGGETLGDDIYAVVNQFENLPENADPITGKPKYKVVIGSATSPDITGDAQRLLCAVAGQVPPDVVWFDRFAIGEWASRGALENLDPYLNSQNLKSPYSINLNEYYQWARDEATYTPPGSKDGHIYGIPWDVDMRLLFCNADMLRQEGFVDKAGQPQPPHTWEQLRQYATDLTRYNTPGDKSSGITRLGFVPNVGDSWLYLFAWEAGAELVNPDRTKITLDTPAVVRALRFMTDLYDETGGYNNVAAFRQSFQSGQLDPFVQNQIAMEIDTTNLLNTVGQWKRNMDFTVTAAPIPQDRLAAGAKPVTWGGGFSLIIPSTARNKEGAWKLIQFLASKPIAEKLEAGRRDQVLATGGLYLPLNLANRTIFEGLVKKYIDGDPRVPLAFQRAFQVIQEMMPRTLHRPVTPVGQLLWEQHIHATETAVGHKPEFHAEAEADLAAQLKAGTATQSDVENDEIRLILADAQRPVQQQLDEILKPLPASTLVLWRPWFFVYGLLLLIPFILIFVAYVLRKKEYSYSARELGAGLLFASPWIIGFSIFVGGPIFFSLLFCFMRYDVLTPAHWVGLDNFRHTVADRLFYQSLGNTAFMILGIPLTMTASLAISLLLNNAIRGRSFYRTACYLPAVTPFVASALLWVWILNPVEGILNKGLIAIFNWAPLHWLQTHLHHFFQPPLWLDDPNWSKPSLILMALWGAGGGIIIWLAGLQSIPDQLYEAASIDGAGPWRRFWNVTIPMLSPYILFNFVIGVIGTMQIFSEAFIMTQGGPFDSTLFYAYHLFRQAFQYFRMGYASTLAWIMFVIVLTLTMIQLWISRKWVHYERT